uniref:phenylalanine--tRNA ligase n=1 Tax=Bostrychia simpliciuscula TaxID=324754 RepID=A0A1Z1M8T7_9FLOR|nr:Phenylalanine-tRNA ligase beta subunit [Bostrychia simpliciuscula]ARW62174.1 Phenylalanine-tRNA ligase beta subunit [Bostrychia simpliciuscula]
MKFSWKLLNKFVDLKNIELTYLKEKLTLCGIEIEEIKENTKTKDKLIYLNNTANRKELYCIINLAKEISIILDLPLKINPINLNGNLKDNKNYTQNIKISKTFLYLKLNLISNIKKNESPEWLINYLKTYDIKTNNLFSDIENYVQIKWGYKIKILNTINIKKQFIDLNITNLQQNLLLIDILNNKNLKNQKKLFNNNNCKILLFYVNKNNNNKLDYSCTEYLQNAYNETINIISTYTKGTIGKSNQKWKTTDKIEHTIKIHKNKIFNVLGILKNRPFKFLSTASILNTLNKLHFHSKYIKRLETFKVIIPIYRIHDLKREIDIVEEIGRIYGFKYFLKNLPSNKKKKSIHSSLSTIRKIRFLLRNLGLNEVVNCSLINKIKPISLKNPITKEQKSLRNNVLENLIENYRYNIKHKNFRIEIFEIGKIFEKDSQNQYIENNNLAGLIYNNSFIRNKWSDKPQSINWFHVKGIIEALLEQLNAEVTLQKLSQYENNKYIKNTSHLFHPIKQIGMYNRLNKELIGTFGELNIKYNINLKNNNKKIYIFEIHIEKLNHTRKINRNLNFNIKKYSHYPSVIRDISIKVKQHTNINDIKKFIFNRNKKLVESIEIFNEYYEKSSYSRFIGLRITYRSNYRTLNNKDIKMINTNIEDLINELKTD